MHFPEQFKKWTLILVGSLSIGLAFLGIFLPLLPTTPFLLLAAACYLRSSDRFYHWLIYHKWFGNYIRNYREGRGNESDFILASKILDELLKTLREQEIPLGIAMFVGEGHHDCRLSIFIYMRRALRSLFRCASPRLRR